MRISAPERNFNTSHLRRFWIDCGGDLAVALHVLVLHGGDVLEAGRRHVPIQGRLTAPGGALAVAGP